MGSVSRSLAKAWPELTKGTASVNGTNLVVWRVADTTYWAASDLDAGELTKFTQAFAAAP